MRNGIAGFKHFLDGIRINATRLLVAGEMSEVYSLKGVASSKHSEGFLVFLLGLSLRIPVLSHEVMGVESTRDRKLKLKKKMVLVCNIDNQKKIVLFELRCNAFAILPEITAYKPKTCA